MWWGALEGEPPPAMPAGFQEALMTTTFQFLGAAAAIAALIAFLFGAWFIYQAHKGGHG